jgi:hypothetical protein
MKNMTQHPTDLSVQFLKEKIGSLERALFFPENHSLLQIPVHLVKAEEVDDLARVWFTIPLPGPFVWEMEKEFPAKLDFFRKGMPYFLKIEGMVHIMPETPLSDECRIAGRMRAKLTRGEAVLLKFVIQKAHYVEAAEKNTPPQSLKRPARTSLLNWLFPPQPERRLAVIPIEQTIRKRSVF